MVDAKVTVFKDGKEVGSVEFEYWNYSNDGVIDRTVNKAAAHLGAVPEGKTAIRSVHMGGYAKGPRVRLDEMAAQSKKDGLTWIHYADRSLPHNNSYVVE